MAYLAEVREKLTKYLGEEKAGTLVVDCLNEIGYKELADLDRVTSPQEILHFGSSLAKRAGIVELVGRSVRIHALNRGARLEAEEELATLGSVKVA
jgi:hypothetical protein